MLKTRTIKDTFNSVSGLSFDVKITLVLTGISLVVYAVANDNPIFTEESPENLLSADVLTDEFSKIQTTLIESVWVKLKAIDTVDGEELQRFVAGQCIGLRYVFTKEETK